MVPSERTCVVCRSKGAKSSLARLVLSGNALVWDTEHALPGRGAYVHMKPECLSKMTQPARWERALRAPSEAVEVASLRKVAAELMESACRPGGPAGELSQAPARRGRMFMFRKGK